MMGDEKYERVEADFARETSVAVALHLITLPLILREDCRFV